MGGMGQVGVDVSGHRGRSGQSGPFTATAGRSRQRPLGPLASAPHSPIRPFADTPLRRWTCQLEERKKGALRILDDGESPGFLYISCGNHDLAATLF
jgi:hypothetical protein